MWTKIIVTKRRCTNPLFQLPFWEEEEGDLEMLKDIITVFYFVSLCQTFLFGQVFLKNCAKNPLL